MYELVRHIWEEERIPEEWKGTIIQGVPPPTKPGSSLIILPLMILQRNLKRTYLIV